MLNGKKAVVTGASRGIGRAVALEMARCGAEIAVLYSGNETAAKKTCDEAKSLGAKALSYACDVSDFEAAKKTCDAIAADFGGVDILVNNAGIVRDSLLLRMSEEDFDAVVGVNLKGAFNFTRHLARWILKSPAGRIINISSVSGLRGNPGQANYSAAKAGVLGLTKTLAKELSSRNVTCNAIIPGLIETDMTANLPPAVKDELLRAVPLRRIGTAQDVANLAVFLASDLSSYITGEVIRVDGGMCI